MKLYPIKVMLYQYLQKTCPQLTPVMCDLRIQEKQIWQFSNLPIEAASFVDSVWGGIWLSSSEKWVSMTFSVFHWCLFSRALIDAEEGSWSNSCSSAIVWFMSTARPSAVKIWLENEEKLTENYCNVLSIRYQIMQLTVASSNWK